MSPRTMPMLAPGFSLITDPHQYQLVLMLVIEECRARSRSGAGARKINFCQRSRYFSITVQAGRSAKGCPSVACNESDRADGSGDLARILPYRVLAYNRPNAAVTEYACRRSALSSPPCAPRVRAV